MKRFLKRNARTIYMTVIGAYMLNESRFLALLIFKDEVESSFLSISVLFTTVFVGLIGVLLYTPVKAILKWMKEKPKKEVKDETIKP